MHKLWCYFSAMILVYALAISPYADTSPLPAPANCPGLTDCSVSTIENGYWFIDEMYEYSTKENGTKTAEHRRNIYASNTLIATIAFRATFYYTGNYVTVVSKAVIQTDTFNGWNYSQISFIGSGGNVTLEGKLSKLLFIPNYFSMSLSCDVNGNISYA